MSSVKKSSVEVISLEDAARISREIAARFGQPGRAVSARTIMNNLEVFRHLFILSPGEPGTHNRFKGVRLKAWKNHVEGRLCLNRSIFSLCA